DTAGVSLPSGPSPDGRELGAGRDTGGILIVRSPQRSRESSSRIGPAADAAGWPSAPSAPRPGAPPSPAWPAPPAPGGSGGHPPPRRRGQDAATPADAGAWVTSAAAAETYGPRWEKPGPAWSERPTGTSAAVPGPQLAHKELLRCSPRMLEHGAGE